MLTHYRQAERHFEAQLPESFGEREFSEAEIAGLVDEVASKGGYLMGRQLHKVDVAYVALAKSFRDSQELMPAELIEFVTNWAREQLAMLGE